MKHIKNIKFSEIESIPQLIKDFLNGRIQDFNEDIFSIDNFRKKILSKSKNYSDDNRRILLEVIKEQMLRLELSEIQKLNIEKLQKKKTFTITTGHQLNLFTGPVFFVYKILQTIKTVTFLQENFPENHFVPVFWMATEDHDFAEINHFKTQNHFYQINEQSGGAVGRIKLSNVSFIQKFEQEFKDSIFGTELILMMKEAYRIGNTLSEATRILVNRLFSEYGILIIDGDDKKLKQLAHNVFKDEIIHQTLISSSKEKINFLTKNYGKVQVNPREINLFYLSETRNRIEKNGEQYKIVDTEKAFSEQEILLELQNNPQNFSPNALMRPVYQELILPNLAYIGGNAEIMYWLELKNYFKTIDLAFPILIPRNSILFVKGKTLNKISKLGLSVEDFFTNFEKIKEKKILENSEIPLLLKEQEEMIQNNFNQLKKVAASTDPSFGNLVKAEEVRQLKSLKNMQKRLLRAEKIKQAELIERLQNLYQEIHPASNWQERVYNFSVFYADEGKDWLETCLEETDATDSILILANI